MDPKAGDLIELQEQLEEAVQYGKLCESRINQLHPSHPLPITQAMVQDYLPPPPTVDEPSSMGPQVRRRRHRARGFVVGARGVSAVWMDDD